MRKEKYILETAPTEPERNVPDVMRQWTDEDVLAVINEVVSHWRSRALDDDTTLNGCFARYILDLRAQNADMHKEISKLLADLRAQNADMHKEIDKLLAALNRRP